MAAPCRELTPFAAKVIDCIIEIEAPTQRRRCCLTPIRILCFLFIFNLLAANDPNRQPLKIDPETLQTLLALEPPAQGFIPIPFRESIGANASPTKEIFFEDAGVLIAEAIFENFCQKQIVCETSFSIPRIIHLIWLGSTPPSTVLTAMESWRKHHPTWEIKLWTDAEAAKFSWSNPRSEYFFHRAKNWAEKSDVLRFEILYQFGGIYSDTDALCLKSFDELVASGAKFLACFEENKIKKLGRPLIGSAVLGAAKHHPILLRCIDYSQTEEEAAETSQHLRSGPGPLTKACYEALETGQENVLILPCSYFYPLPWRKRLDPVEEIVKNIRPESFSIHLWEGSWFGIED